MAETSWENSTSIALVSYPRGNFEKKITIFCCLQLDNFSLRHEDSRLVAPRYELTLKRTGQISTKNVRVLGWEIQFLRRQS